MSVLLGVMGIIGALFMAAIGLVLGLAGVVMGTLSRRSVKRSYSTAGIIFSSLAIVVSLGTWVHYVRNDPRFNPNVAHAAPKDGTASVASQLDTPCYSVNFVDQLNIDSSPNSCEMDAYNGQSLESSTNAYKIYANKTPTASVNDFMAAAKKAVERDVSQNLAGFTTDSEKVASFAGNPAYMINVSDKGHQVSLVEAAVLHKDSAGSTIFVIIHANNGDSADLQILESQWQWK
jgi:hypothetical protein